MNDATSTKQSLDGSTGMVILAGNDTTDRYWWHYDPLGGTPPVVDPPVAAFSATPTSGPAPLTVSFTDTSTNTPTSWAWDLDGNGSTDSTARESVVPIRDPGHLYRAADGDEQRRIGRRDQGRLRDRRAAADLHHRDPVRRRVRQFGQRLQELRHRPRAARPGLEHRLPRLPGLRCRRPDRAGPVRQAPPVRDRRQPVERQPSTPSPARSPRPGSPGTTSRPRRRRRSPRSGRRSPVSGARSTSGPPSPATAPTGSRSSARTRTAPTSAAARARTRHSSSIGTESGGTEPAAPVAAFLASPTSGSAPLSVAFTDTSTNSPTSWAWDVDGNGTIDSTAQHPTFVYPDPGTYTVTLTATNAIGSDDETKTGLHHGLADADRHPDPDADRHPHRHPDPDAHPDPDRHAAAGRHADLRPGRRRPRRAALSELELRVRRVAARPGRSQR